MKNQLEKTNKIIEQIVRETKEKINMSLGMCYKNENEYYLIADTRSIIEENENAIVKNDSTHKIVVLDSFPMAILNTGFNEFTKERFDFETYAKKILNPFVDKLNQNDFVHPHHIANKIKEDIEKSLLQYEKENKLPFEKGVGKEKLDYYKRHSNELIFVYFDYGINNIQVYTYNIIAFIQSLPTSFEIETCVSCGDLYAEKLLQNMLKTKETTNIIPFVKYAYKEIFDKLPQNRKVINDKLDILKINGDTFEWIERQ